jgi:hypothetical protein
MAKKLSQHKAKEILKDGTAQGHPLTKKQKRFFGAIAGGEKPKFQHSPDRFNPEALGETPPRLEYHKDPENLNTGSTAKKSGGSRGSIEQSEGTDNTRANYKTKSADIPSPKQGSTRWGAIDSYNDTTELP